MSLPASAFDIKPEPALASFRRDIRPTCPQDKTSRLLPAAVTIAGHMAAAVMLVVGMHVVTVVRPPPPMVVYIAPPRPEPAQNTAPPPALLRPALPTAQMPEIVTPAPASILTVQPEMREATPPAPVAGPPKISGETRDTFRNRLLQQLNRFKQYPREARQAHIEGVVMLHFVMDASGKVLSFEIAASSGRPALDREALALIQRAQPLPALPPEMGNRFDAIVPVEFFLR